MRIAEIYQSDQGEGILTGTPSVFVRASGCNLRCTFCDTPFTSWAPEGTDRGVTEIVQMVRDFDCEHVVLTGGEPMLFAELIPICEELKQAGHHLTIETAGTLYLPVTCDLMSISPKMKNSTPTAARDANWHLRHERVRYAPIVINRLMEEYEYQLKFVVASLDDLPEIEEYLSNHPLALRERVLLMPEGTDKERLATVTAWLQPECERRRFTYCPRKHIEWFGFERGT
jgi:7-carboxy-7-deazaguanine synthase